MTSPYGMDETVPLLAPRTTRILHDYATTGPKSIEVHFHANSHVLIHEWEEDALLFTCH